MFPLAGKHEYSRRASVYQPAFLNEPEVTKCVFYHTV